MSRGVGIVVGIGISSFFPLTSSIIKTLTSYFLHQQKPLASIVKTMKEKIEDVVDDLAQYCHKNGGALI